MTEDILKQAQHYYDTHQEEPLRELAETSWPDSLTTDDLPPGLSEACRYLRILAHKRKDAVNDQLWFARALSAAVLTGARDTAAGLVLTPFFILTEKKQHEPARRALGEVLRLIPPDHPRADLFRRIYYEKLAFSFAQEGRFGEASDAYRHALDHCSEDPRGALKVRGGAAIAGYLALRGRPEGEIKELAAPLLQELQKIRAEAGTAGFVDVAEAAEGNTQLMEARPRRFEPWFPFEVT